MLYSAKKILFIAALACIAFPAGYILLDWLLTSQVDLADFIHKFSRLLEQFHPFWFITSMLLLPPAGFPFSIFLALAGIRFGVVLGILITFLILPLHMAICYTITHTFLRTPLINYLSKKGWEPPILHTRRPNLAMIGFLLIPGPPYILKTYLLSMTGLPFHRFLFVNWATESLITLPIVAMTGAVAEKNWYLFAAVLVIFGLSIVLRWLKKRRHNQVPSPEIKSPESKSNKIA